MDAALTFLTAVVTIVALAGLTALFLRWMLLRDLETLVAKEEAAQSERSRSGQPEPRDQAAE